MQTLVGFRAVRVPSLRRGLVKLGGFLVQMHRMIEGRRAIAQMDAHMLSDIGLSRAEAQEEVSRKPWDMSTRR